MTTETKVLREVRGNVAVITLNRPQQRNAIDAETALLLREAIDWLENDDTLRVGILRGSGPVFCAGMDLKAFANGEADQILFGPGGFGGFVSRVRTKPVIAAVQGAALAGGFEVMLACDLVVATKASIFGLPESKRGLVAGGGGAFRLGQILPRAIAKEILLTGDPISADRAYDFGLINKLVDDDALLDSAVEMADKIAANAPLSIGSSLELARAPLSHDEKTCWTINDRLLKIMLNSNDAMEGAKAFAEKRAPKWLGN